MQNISYILNLLLLGTAVFLAIENREIRSKLLQTNNVDPYNLCKEYDSTFIGLEDSLLLEMTKNYDVTSTTYQGSFNPGTNPVPYSRGNSFHEIWNSSGQVDKLDTRSMCLPLDTLDKFMRVIRKEVSVRNLAKKESFIKMEDLGIRIYFARYPEFQKEGKKYESLLSVPDTYAMRQTIFIIPTYKKGKINVDFDPHVYDSIQETYPPLTVLRDRNPKRRTFGYLMFSAQAAPMNSSTNQIAQNHGTLCPSECGGSAY